MSKLSLKWGTLKAWDFTDNESGLALLREYFDIGASMGAATQKDTERQRQIIKELIELCDDPKGIYLDYYGEHVDKAEAIEYVDSYGL